MKNDDPFDPASLFEEEDYERPNLPSDFMKPDADFEALMGDQIGSGGSRNVYEAKGNQHAVLKVIKLETPAANWSEFFIWSHIRGTKLESLFGQILGISQSGKHLMMERLQDLEAHEREATFAPPVWLNDVKPDAFGKDAKGNIKLRDYGMTKLGPTLAKADTRPAGWQITRNRMGLK